VRAHNDNGVEAIRRGTEMQTTPYTDKDMAWREGTDTRIRIWLGWRELILVVDPNERPSEVVQEGLRLNLVTSYPHETSV